jgi:fido (protein-threonine AMPylation protein)
MAAEDSRPQPPAEIAGADRLYGGFPDFAAWDRLGTDERDLWDRFTADLAERRQGASPEDLERAVRVAVRAAALDTGAIEGLYSTDRGFTMSVAFQSLAWEQMIAERGEGVRELFEAQLEAYELVIDAVTQRLPVTEAWLRALHERLCAPQATYRVRTEMGWQEQILPRGSYKEHPNHVLLADGSVHAYAPVDRVPAEMHCLVEQLRAPEFAAAHPVEQASYAHYALTVIHPFADGNGRVARALASTYFYRAQSIPLGVFANQKLGYFDVLHTADEGDPGPLLAFFRDRGIDTMQLVAETLRTAEVPEPGLIAPRLGNLLFQGFSHTALDSLALRLLEEMKTVWQQRIGEACAAIGVSSQVLKAESHRAAPVGYRRIGGKPAPVWSIVLEAPAPATVRVDRAYGVAVAADSSNPFTFRFQALDATDDLEVRLEDVHSELSEAFRLRLDSWVQRHLGRMLAELEERVRASLERYK